MSKSLPAASKAVRHPLTPVIKFARDEADYIERTIRDFSCRVTKRERIDGELQDYMYLNLSVRQAVKRDEQVVEPYSVFVSFLGPKKVRGRKVLFIEGENEGKMLVRNGGERFSFVVVPISIDSDAVRRESQLLITDIGFDRMAKSMVKLLEKHAALDPQASNTQVNVFKNAKINDRACTRVQIVHPQEQERLEFHMVNVFVDDELHVPVRVEKYLWPASAGQEAILDAEYTYTNLVINPGLSNSYFTRENLKQSGKSTKAKKP